MTYINFKERILNAAKESEASMEILEEIFPELFPKLTFENPEVFPAKDGTWTDEVVLVDPKNDEYLVATNEDRTQLHLNNRYYKWEITHQEVKTEKRIVLTPILK